MFTSLVSGEGLASVEKVLEWVNEAQAVFPIPISNLFCCFLSQITFQVLCFKRE